MSDSPRDDEPRRARKQSKYSDSKHGYSRRRHDRVQGEDLSSDVRSHSHRNLHREHNRRDDRESSYRRDRKYRERSTSQERSDYVRRSRSPPAKRRRRSRSASGGPERRSRVPLPSQDESFRGTGNVAVADGPPVEKQKPNYKPTGLLAKEANTVTGTTTVLKYHEPAEARKPPPKEQWRMYVFKKDDMKDTVYLHERSCWLMGRDQTVTDLFIEHPSISKQHAVIQFRYTTSTNEFGDKQSRVKPYLIDLESANGTKLNGKKVEASRYVELVDGDVVAFGDSERDYVLMLPPVEK